MTELTLPLAGKSVIVTGSGRGLGAAFAEACCAAGARVAVAEILVEEGERVAAALRDRGHDAVFVPLDLADPASVERMAETVVERFGGIDGLVNNGAVATGIGGKRYDEIDVATWDRVMTVNARGTFLAIKACAPHLRRSGAGKIVNIASDTALWGGTTIMHYVASKGAVIAMTRAFARELGEDNICINAIAPGLTLVEATEYVSAERHRLYVEGRAIKRQQFPEDLTGAVVFLLSDGASFITGQTLPVNGGFVFN